jgi:hypothetical protein
MLSMILFVLAVLSALATLGVLGAGMIVMARGGDVALKWSNRLMRWRVSTQAITIVLIVAFIVAAQNG